MIAALLCIVAVALMAVAHVVRDGLPALGRTFYARAAGAALCVLAGGLAGLSWQGALMGALIGAGFWADMKHGEGARARDLRDAAWLMLSGFTSVLPLAAGAGYMFGAALFSAVALIGALMKPAIWFAAWALNLQGRWRSAEPTRVAAGVFGALIGIVVVIVLA